MAAPTLILGEPLMVEEKSNRRGGKFLALFLVLLGVSCVTLWALGGGEQQTAAMEPIEALGMPTARTRQIMQPSSARIFMQPVQASKKDEEVIMPITRRDMMAAAALGAATLPSVAQAEEQKENFACLLARLTRPFLGYGGTLPQADECRKYYEGKNMGEEAFEGRSGAPTNPSSSGGR